MQTVAGKSVPMTYDEAMARLVAVAKQHRGVVTARDVEGDADFAANREIASAVGHALAGSTNVFAVPNHAGWFPYAELRFSELR